MDTADTGSNLNATPAMVPLTDRQALEILADVPASSSLLEPQETSQPNRSFLSYRGKFLQGKEDEYRATLEAYEAMFPDEYNSHRQALQHCRQYATFKRDKMSGAVKVFSSSCRDRWCPMCAGAKAGYAKEQAKMFIDSLTAPRMLTLTLRNNDSTLKEQIDFLTQSFRTLRQRAYWKQHVDGGVWFLQVKRGKDSGRWHPHFHILLDGEYMEQARLSELWEQVTFGSPVIDIRRIHDVESMAAYVARYTARPAVLGSMTLEDRIEVIISLFRRRMCGTFGTAKAVTLTPPKVEDNSEWSDLGFYDEIVLKAKRDPLAKEILKAYYTDEPISEELFTQFTGLPVHSMQIEYVPPTDIQPYLDFY